MARLCNIGFENNASTELWYNTGCTVGSTQKYGGVYSIYAPSTAAFTAAFGLFTGLNNASLYYRTRFLLETDPATTQCKTYVAKYENSAGTRLGEVTMTQKVNGTVDMAINDNTGAAVTTVTAVVMPMKQWNRIEAFFQQGNPGVCTVRLNGTQVLTNTTANFGITNINRMEVGLTTPATVGHGVYFDDMVIDDTTWIGDIQAPCYAGVSSAVEVASGNITLTEPTGVQAGDLLVACISYRSTAAFTLPTGWALVATQNSGGNTTVNTVGSIVSCLMAYIVRGSSAPSLVFTRTAGDLALGRITAFRGTSSESPYDAGTTTVLGAASVTVNGAAVTTTQANELLVMAAAMARNNTASAEAATDPPAAGWREAADSGTITGADGALAVAYATKGVAGSTGTPTYTASASALHGNIVGAFFTDMVRPQAVL